MKPWLDGTMVEVPLDAHMKIFPVILSNRGEKFKGDKNRIFVHANALSIRGAIIFSEDAGETLILCTTVMWTVEVSHSPGLST